MWEWLLSIDEKVFLFLNRDIAHPGLDILMPFITELDNTIIPLVLFFLGLCLFGGKKGRITVLILLIVILIADQLSSSVIKPLAGRLRPAHPDNLIEGARYLLGTRMSFSFPSSHAANNAAAAFWLTYQYPKSGFIFIPFALAVAFSRIYVGVHYPTDILGGIILGMMITGAVIVVKKKIEIYWKWRKKKNESAA